MSKSGEFWDEQLSSLDFSGIGFERNLSDTDRKVITQRYHASIGDEPVIAEWPLDSRRRGIKRDITDFATRLGATPEEIEFDILRPFGLIQENPAPQVSAILQEAKRLGVLARIRAWFTRDKKQF